MGGFPPACVSKVWKTLRRLYFHPHVSTLATCTSPYPRGCMREGMQFLPQTASQQSPRVCQAMFGFVLHCVLGKVSMVSQVGEGTQRVCGEWKPHLPECTASC